MLKFCFAALNLRAQVMLLPQPPGLNAEVQTTIPGSFNTKFTLSENNITLV